jgi:hypothetical protein
MSHTPTSQRAPLFNHVFVVVDAATLAAINACAFLSGELFGRFLAIESESSLIGRYRPTRIFGENTLIELFPERFGYGPEFGAVTAGIVLSFDHGGEREAARARFSNAGAPYRGELVVRETTPGADPTPFYQSTRPDLGAGNPVALFASEIAPAPLARLGLSIGPDRAQDRAGYLAATLRRPHGPQFALQDIIAVSVRLHPERAERMARALALLGYRESAEAEARRLTGPEAEIVILEGPGAQGVTQVRMKLRAPHAEPGRRFDFGPSCWLILSPGGPNDDEAIWSFTPLEVAPPTSAGG